MTASPIIETARALVTPGKGILAADESTPTMARRLATVGVESTEAVRRRYREMLFTTPGLASHISGVILYDETIRQRADDGRPLPDVLHDAGLVPGIKVDAGTTALAGFSDEVVTQGLDGLRERFADYVALGARFAKWRAVLRVGQDRPSRTCIEANAHALARYAALAQEAGLTPVVEPEVLMEGAHHLERTAHVTTEVLRTVYDHLARQRVVLEGTLLKPNMVVPGADCPHQVDHETVATHTLEVLRRAVPAAVPGVVFLSGGMTDEQATARLDAMNRQPTQPWQLSFSFGRALQGPVLRAWSGDDSRWGDAQAALLHRAALNSAARSGTYSPEMEDMPPAPRASA
jgi:fructose-bisphosphate aldolase class I